MYQLTSFARPSKIGDIVLHGPARARLSFSPLEGNAISDGPHHVAVKSMKMGREAALSSRVLKAASLPIVMTCPFDIAEGQGGGERCKRLVYKQEKRDEKCEAQDIRIGSVSCRRRFESGGKAFKLYSERSDVPRDNAYLGPRITRS